MFLKSNTAGIMKRAGYRMAIISLLRVFNGWRILGGLTKLFMPVMGGKFIWRGNQTRKFMAIVKK